MNSIKVVVIVQRSNCKRRRAKSKSELAINKSEFHYSYVSITSLFGEFAIIVIISRFHRCAVVRLICHEISNGYWPSPSYPYFYTRYAPMTKTSADIRNQQKDINNKLF